MRKIHVGFLAGAIAILGLCGLGMFLLHSVQIQRNAKSLLDRARSAEASGKLAEAEALLSLYLGIRREDSSAWVDFARITDDRAKSARDRERVFLVHEEALRKNPDDRGLERRLAELAMDLDRSGDARRHLKRLNEGIQADPGKAAESAELEDLLGQCDQKESRFAEAEQHYRKAIELDPTRVVAFDRLARLLRHDLKNPDAADRVIEGMSSANHRSALAHVLRWRYQRDFGPDANPSDIAQALELGPDDAEVLVAAAELARQNKNLDEARKLCERGMEQHSENATFYQWAADIELAENHLDRAEAILRRGVKTVQFNIPLEVMLAEILIGEHKLEGDEGALASIEALRKKGLAEGYITFLEARIAMNQQGWSQAILKLSRAARPPRR